MRWTWFKDTERTTLVPSENRDSSYDSFNDQLSTANGGDNGKSVFGLLRRRKKVLQETNSLDLKWRWIFVTCFITYFGSWLVFACLWYLITYLHNDLDPANNHPTSDHIPCVTGVVVFASLFLFSVETQHTIGYGNHYVTEEWGLGVLLLCLQSIVGVILEGLVVGLVYLKISRAKKRSEYLVFSRNAVICHRDGKKYLMFRVVDTRARSHLLEAHIRAQILWKRVTTEGELITHTQEEITVHGDGEKGDKILLFWPTTILHAIDKSSPLNFISQKDLTMENNSFEIIVILEGVLETTGLMTQARSSFAPHEIRWGHRFREIVYKKSSSNQRIMDYSIFDQIIEESHENQTQQPQN